MKEDQRILLTKRLLREGLLRLLKTKDISAIRITELCTESGINRATFYRHYQQPRDIIVEIRHEMFREIKHLAETDNAKNDPGKWLEHMCQYFYDNADLLRILIHCRTDDEFVTLINELYQNKLRLLRTARYAAGLDDAELKLTTHCIAGGIYYLLRQWITEPIDKTPQEVAVIIHRFIGI